MVKIDDKILGGWEKEKKYNLGDGGKLEKIYKKGKQRENVKESEKLRNGNYKKGKKIKKMKRGKKKKNVLDK